MSTVAVDKGVPVIAQPPDILKMPEGKDQSQRVQDVVARASLDLMLTSLMEQQRLLQEILEVLRALSVSPLSSAASQAAGFGQSPPAPPPPPPQSSKKKR